MLTFDARDRPVNVSFRSRQGRPGNGQFLSLVTGSYLASRPVDPAAGEPRGRRQTMPLHIEAQPLQVARFKSRP
jgi:hypothetical protein